MDVEIVLSLGRRLVELNEVKAFDSVPYSVEADTARYVDSKRWDLEKTEIFGRLPQLVGLSADVAEPGDYWAFQFAGKPVVLVRGSDGFVRGFVNACRHRGTAFAEGRGKAAKQFVCPYHAWAYDTRGRLVGVPERGGFGDCNLETRNLIELPVAEEFGLIVMSPTVDVTPSVSELLGPMLPQIAPFDLGRACFVKSRSQEIPINWKLINEATIEGYHVIPLHGATLKKWMGDAGLRYFTYDRFGNHSRMVAGQKPLLNMEICPANAQEVFNNMNGDNYIFPSSFLSFGGQSVAFQRAEPGAAPNKAILTITNYSWDPNTTEEARAASEALFDVIWEISLTEDVASMATAQRAFDAGYPPTVVYGGVEPGVQDVNAAWDAALIKGESN